jgi:hypothetical protein
MVRMNNKLNDGISAVPLPCDPAQFRERHHIIQIYDDERTFMESLECFVTCGLRAGDGVVLFATARHLQDLQIRLHSSQLQLDRASWQDRYIPVVANEVLHKIMVGGWPDEQLFKKVIGAFLDRAQAGGREVRAFGEIVEPLMANGELAATVRVEQLWNECCQERKLTLLCAYSRSRLAEDSSGTVEAICEEHDWMLNGYAGAEPMPTPLSSGYFDYLHRLGVGFEEALAFDLARDAARANFILAPASTATLVGLFLPQGSKSAAGWSIAGTHHSETGTRWMLRPLH